MTTNEENLKVSKEKLLLKLREAINNTDLFFIDKENDRSEYTKSYNKLQNLIASYYQKKLKPNIFLNSGLEIVSATIASINNYERSKGEFFIYLDYNVNKKIKREAAKRKASDVRSGMKISRKLDVVIRKLVTFSKQQECKEIYELNQKQISCFCMQTGISQVEVERAIMANSNMMAEDMDSNILGEDLLLRDTIESSNLDVESNSKSEFENTARLINQEFNNLQNRGNQRKIISLVLTKKFAFNINKEEESILKNMDFFDKELYKKILQNKNDINSFSNKELAKNIGILEASFSRTWNEFINKIRSLKK